MSRNESDREDLMREAVSLIRRIECRTSSPLDPIIVGVNSAGWLFVYLGNDVMYRFDEKGGLRRAFIDGFLYRTEGTTLGKLERRRASELDDGNAHAIPKTTLLRRDLTSEELTRFRLRMHQELALVSAAVRSNEIARQHPPDATGLAEEMQNGIQRVLETREFLAKAIVRRSR